MTTTDAITDAMPSVARLRAREPAAFTWLVAHCERIVLGLAQALGLHGADLDDAAADVFLAVYRALPSFEARSAVTTWVYAIACRVLQRSAIKRRRTRGVSFDEARHAAAGALSADQCSIDRERDEAIWAAVAALEPRSAMAVELHYRRGLNIEEIAATLQCPGGTVKTLLFRARAVLRNRLAELEPSR